MKVRVVFHPLLVAAFPMLFLFSHNFNQAPFGDVVAPLAASLTVAAVLWGVLSLLLKSVSTAALISSLALLLFFTYGHAISMAGHLLIGNFFLGRNRYFLAVWALALLSGTVLILRGRRNKRRLDSITGFANLFSAIMVSISLVHISYFQICRTLDGKEPSSVVAAPFKEEKSQEETRGPARQADSSQALPDIYYIIPDSYEANSSLKEMFGYDNSAFSGFLEEKGFIIASKSTSNYSFTMPSLASSLNMEMVTDLRDRLGKTSTDMVPLGRMISDNKVMAFLKTKGYTLVNAGSWWGPTFKNRQADINLQATRFNEFAIKLLETTVFYAHMQVFTADDLRAKTLFALDNIGEIPYLEAPTFTLAHIICPHPPYVFGPDGEKVSGFSRLNSKSSARRQYLDQVKFMNGKLKVAVEKILARSQTPPIIIIQGDHGAAYTREGPVYVDAMPDDAYCKEQMRIFNAFYLPGAGKGAIGDTITPVNTFRAIFNAYFGTDLPMLRNENYYSNRILPYAFVDVTEKVRYKE